MGPREKVARLESLLMHHPGVDEDDIEAEAGAVGHVAEGGAGTLHPAEDGHAFAERRVGEAQDLERRALLEASIDWRQRLARDSNGHSLNFCAMGIRRPTPNAF